MSKPKIQPLKVTFEIDLAGLIYDPFSPPMLDGLIDWALSPMVRKKDAPTRSGEVDEIRLPLGTWHAGRFVGLARVRAYPRRWRDPARNHPAL